MAGDMTVAQLERLLESKKSTLDGLQKKREKLQKQLSAIEDKISAVGGVSLDRSFRKPRKRPKNDRTLLEVVLDVLGQNKKGLSLADLSAACLETGYKTGSSKFENTVYQCLYNNSDKIVHDPVTRTYRLK